MKTSNCGKRESYAHELRAGTKTKGPHKVKLEVLSTARRGSSDQESFLYATYKTVSTNLT